MTVSDIISLDNDLLDEIEWEAGVSNDPGPGKTM
jgi:hypothetical protein